MSPHAPPATLGADGVGRTEMRCLLFVPESEVDVLKLEITV